MSQPDPPKSQADRDREAKLASALRANLRRRKAGKAPAEPRRGAAQAAEQG